MRDDGPFTKRLLGASITAGMIMGVLYHLMMRHFDEAIRAAENLRGETHYSWVPTIIFMLASGAFGWVSTWLVEWVSGVCGPVQWIPLGVSLMIAILTGVGLSALLIAPIPNSTWLIFLWASAGFITAAGIHMKLTG